MEEISCLTEWPNREGTFDMSFFPHGSFLRVQDKPSRRAQSSVVFTGFPRSLKVLEFNFSFSRA